ncbi:MFS transporter [Dactylosporangium sp. NPDC050688]|uniref:MFS transporter n=1 Tax=Dactylosporangium sp. NPDC050688 TaxID=3157217 RepID=UPI0033DCF736
MTASAAAPDVDSTRRVTPLLVSTGVSVTGDGAFLAAGPLLAASLTRDPVAISAVTAAFYVPWPVFGLPAGALVDRWSRRAVMVVADIVRAGLLAGLAVLVATGYVSLPALVASIVVIGVAQIFFDSAAQATIPAVVGRDKETLAHVNGRYWALDMVGRSLLGPPLGSLTFVLNRTIPFAFDAVSFLVSALFVRRLPATRPADVQHEPIGAAIKAGVRHLAHTRELRILAMSMGAYNFGYNLALATFVLYVTDVLDVSDAVYGVLLAAGAIGGVAVGWRAGLLTRNLSYRQTAAIVHVGQALGWAGIALAANVWVTGVMFVLLGASGSLSSVAIGSARQALTPDGLLGRVVSAFRIIGLGSAGLGALVGGVVADRYGLTTPLLCAVGLLLVAAVLTWPFRKR